MSSEQRTSLYGAVAAILGALSAFGAITAEEATAYGAAAVEGVGAVALLISAIKTWRQRGQSALVTLKLDGTGVENAEAITRALRQLQGRGLV